MKKRFIVSALMLVCFAFAKAQSVNTSYFCLANGDIVLADLSNCSSTVVASHFYSFFDIARGDTDDTLYGIRNEEISRINVTTGTVTSLGMLNVIGFNGLFRVDSLVKEGPGTLLGVNTNHPGGLFRIDIPNMTATLLGNTGFASAGDLTFYNGELYLSADGNRLVHVDVTNPGNSYRVGNISSAPGFNTAYGVVSIITANPCSINPTLELVASGGDDTRFVNVNTAQSSPNCTNIVTSDIFGAAEVTSDLICSMSLDISDSNNVTDYCQTANTVLQTTVDPLNALGTYSYEWTIQGQTGIVGTSATLPISINTTTTYICTVTDSGRVAPDHIAADAITIYVNPIPSFNPIGDVIAYQTYTLPAITGTNLPANTAFYDNPLHTGTPRNPGDIINDITFNTNPATIYVYGIDANGCDVTGQFQIDFVDVQVLISPSGIQDVCVGSTVDLTAIPSPNLPYGTYTYNWNDSQGNTYPNTATISATINSATTISVSVNDSGVINGSFMGNDSVSFNILPVIDINSIADQNTTNNFTFPAITGTSLSGTETYYTQPNGAGTSYQSGDIVTSADFATLPVTLYIYDDNGTCDDEELFVLDIVIPPSVQISATDTEICAGETITLTAVATPVTAVGNYSYEWREQGVNTVMSTTSTFTATPSSTTIYECTITDSGLAYSNTATEILSVTVTPQPDITPIADQNTTNNFTFPVINGTSLSGTETYYTQPNGAGTSYQSGDIVTSADFATLPVTLYIYDDNGTCDDEESFLLDIVIPPSVQISATDTDICAGETITLTAVATPVTAVGNYFYEWREQGSSAVLSTTSIFTATPSSTTIYECTITDSGLAYSNTAMDQLNVTVTAQPDITPIADQNTTNNFTFPVINGTSLSGAEEYYTQPNGAGTSYQSGDVVTSADFTALPVTLYIYDDNGICHDEESFVLDIVIPPSVQISATDTEICAGETITLTAVATPGTAVGTYSYEWREQGVNTVLSTTSTFTATPSSTTIYECKITDSGLAYNNTATEQINITVTSQPDINSIADQNTTYNFTFPVINGTSLSGNEAYYTQPNGTGTSYQGNDVVAFSDFNTFPITLYIYDTNGSCDDQKSFELDIIMPPSLSLESDRDLICAGETVTITSVVDPTISYGTYTYEWTEQGGTAVLSTTSTLSVAPVSTTTYTCSVTDNGLATLNTAIESITITVNSQPLIDDIASQSALQNYTLPVITGTDLSGFEAYYTEPNGGGTSFVPGDVLSIVDFPNFPITLYVYDINDSGCEHEIWFDLMLQPLTENEPEPLNLLNIPDYVTPNGDGYHDYWQVASNHEAVQIKNIYIHNRYGKLLKQLDPTDLGWDATHNGNPLPSSSYWYSIVYEYDGESREKSGYFAVKR